MGKKVLVALGENDWLIVKGLAVVDEEVLEELHRDYDGDEMWEALEGRGVGVVRVAGHQEALGHLRRGDGTLRSV
ncbi:MAG: hypothetical protein P3W93_003745 [Thermus sp.]|nr:hypothetical protein [Thermus sp.]